MERAFLGAGISEAELLPLLTTLMTIDLSAEMLYGCTLPAY